MTLIEKRCTKCGEMKPCAEFSPGRTRDGLQSWCKRCKREHGRDANRDRMRGYVSPQRRRNQAIVDEHKRRIGCRCGERDPIALDLHHRDPDEKTATVAALMNGATALLIAEVAKCDVICANCHRKLHRDKFAQYGWRDYRRRPQARNG